MDDAPVPGPPSQQSRGTAPTPWQRARSWLVVLSRSRLQEARGLTLGLSGQRWLGLPAHPIVSPFHRDLGKALLHGP